ncbi:AMP-dependent synthetase [Rhodothermaceae bacterium RA]|nr:AMP-dependent synthetase [Rhodothermaceae bacterium RA]
MPTAHDHRHGSTHLHRPPDSGQVVLGKTLPDLLYEACERYAETQAFYELRGDGWIPVSLASFREQAEDLALGLRGLPLERGDRVAMFMESDVPFCIVDMACLLGGLIDVPIYLTHAAEALQYVIAHAEARALVVSNLTLLAQIAPVLRDTPTVETVIVGELEPGGRVPVLPEHVRLATLREMQAEGRGVRAADPGRLASLRAQIHPHDVATIIYTSGTTGTPKGVVLTHENISFNALTSFSGLAGYTDGEEVGASFLPLTHIFARTLQYGYLATGSTVYFTRPDRLSKDLQRIRPTFFATVPRVIEKVYGRILERATTLKGAQKQILNWAIALARRYELGREPKGFYKAQLALADRLVYVKWREALGGRIKYIISGGAALSGDLANFFAAAGIPILQGYGLTETSPVITYNRPHLNRAGTVGVPLPGVEVMIADDGEILTRGPHVMQGYFRDEERTREVIDDEGWFHTGDIGEFTDEGFLRITDRKKDMFKLSTGKYVVPQPLENRLVTEPLVEQAVVVGSGYKFCTALIFPEEDALRTFAASRGLDPAMPLEQLVREPVVLARYQELVDKANEGMDHWMQIKRFALVPAHLTVENGMLTPTLKVRRSRVREAFADQIRALYDGEAPEPRTAEPLAAGAS